MAALFASIASSMGGQAKEPDHQSISFEPSMRFNISAPAEIVACVPAATAADGRAENGIKKAVDGWRRMAVERGVERATSRYTIGVIKDEKITNYVCAGIEKEVASDVDFKVNIAESHEGLITYCEYNALKTCLQNLSDISSDKYNISFPRVVGWPEQVKPQSVEEMTTAIFGLVALQIKGAESNSDSFKIDTGGLKPIEVNNEQPGCGGVIGLCDENIEDSKLRGYILFMEKKNVSE
ncbi:hypothetical protein [Xanthobacter autotrophicus]|uniref:hypothetical protein n=1 Tax=Xanthobacter autotrophicus TaxID=280 RepID=UPI0037281830